MKFFALTLAALCATPALADDPFWLGSDPDQVHEQKRPPADMKLQKLITLSNDRDASLSHLNAMVDKNGQAAGLYNKLEERGGFRVFDDEVDPVIWLRDIESKDGAVLFASQGRKAILIQGQLDRETQEGRFTIRYLANGVSMRYASCDILLRHKEGKWWVQNAYTKKKVTEAKITTWSFGITTLEGICPE